MAAELTEREVTQLKQLIQFLPVLQNARALGQAVKTIRLSDTDILDTGIYAKLAEDETITGLWNFLLDLQTDSNVEFKSGTAVKGILDHANAVERTYTFQDKNYTVADNADIITDHGALSGLADNDHPQYVLDAGDTMTGTLDMGANKITTTYVPVNGPDLTNKTYVDSVAGVSDHGALTGLADDDHTQYVLADGTRAFTGNQSFGGFNITSAVWAGTAIGATVGGTGLTTYTLGDLLYSSASNVLSKLAGNTTTTKKFLSQTGTGAASAAPVWETIEVADISDIGTAFTEAYLPDGVVIQRVVASTSAVGTTSANIPVDDTIPQNTEGAEFLTVTITPQATTNSLRILFSGFVGHDTLGQNVAVALFQDSTAGALAAVFNTAAGVNYGKTHVLQYEMAAGTTSATTFKIRMGTGAGTLTVNGVFGGRLFGGVAATFLVVEEVKA